LEREVKTKQTQKTTTAKVHEGGIRVSKVNNLTETAPRKNPKKEERTSNGRTGCACKIESKRGKGYLGKWEEHARSKKGQGISRLKTEIVIIRS
jgi:hypothetical protein